MPRPPAASPTRLRMVTGWGRPSRTGKAGQDRESGTKRKRGQKRKSGDKKAESGTGSGKAGQDRKAGQVRYWQYGQAEIWPDLAISDPSRFCPPVPLPRPLRSLVPLLSSISDPSRFLSPDPSRFLSPVSLPVPRPASCPPSRFLSPCCPCPASCPRSSSWSIARAGQSLDRRPEPF